MTSPAKSDNVLRYKLRYSRFLFKLEVLTSLILLASLLAGRFDLWLLPALCIYLLLIFIFFAKYSIIRQFGSHSAVEFRSSPERLIWYDQNTETDFLQEEIDVIITRWFVLLKLGKRPNQMNRVMLKDSFDDMNHYSSFRRQILLKLR
ncbi:MAG: hypothetical protein H8E21_16425 [Gammaproteobacteria bacterium]|nr:hypothetical protein [Gammaproteobacteria bacterium]